MQQYSTIKEIGPHKKYYNTACPVVNFPVDNMINEVINSTAVINVPESPQATNLIKLWDSGAAVKEAVKAVEQLGKEFDWEGTIKHAKGLELIEGKTGLTSEEIYNKIKVTVLEVNKPKEGNTITQ